MTRAAHRTTYARLHNRKSGRSIGFAVAATALAMAVLSACSGGDDKKGPEATLEPTRSDKPVNESSSTPSPSETDPNAAEKQAVLDTYDRLWDEQVKAYGQGSIKGTQMRKYTAGYALADTETDLETLQKKGIVAKGSPTHDVSVTGLKPDKKVPWASLTDCLDTSDWKYVYEKTGKPVDMPENRVSKYLTKVQAEKWGKTWKIVQLETSGTSC
ncbi:hypothetical protein [Streptomyces sp. NPDC050145]|uniref:hypothetical protein n=1 Tax=Streptomyces sp. NPDC050145 TaxID=3365602 RepID=UPI00378F643A